VIYTLRIFNPAQPTVILMCYLLVLREPQSPLHSPDGRRQTQIFTSAPKGECGHDLRQILGNLRWSTYSLQRSSAIAAGALFPIFGLWKYARVLNDKSSPKDAFRFSKAEPAGEEQRTLYVSNGKVATRKILSGITNSASEQAPENRPPYKLKLRNSGDTSDG
jgi:hypothetical protein